MVIGLVVYKVVVFVVCDFVRVDFIELGFVFVVMGCVEGVVVFVVEVIGIV